MKDFVDIDTEGKKAVIYCRVSGKKQKKEGSGLTSQEHRCRQYAEAKGYTVEETFPDDYTGKGDYLKRPGMVKLLAYLDAHPHENFVVIFDDLRRFARDVEFHLNLRRAMAARNATRECLNFNFEDSPEGKFSETISAAAGEYEREHSARQNWQKSIARLEQGYCVQSVPPVGYKYELSPAGGKVLVRDEPNASLVQEALEGYATDRFGSIAEVQRFLEAQPEFPKKGKNGTLTHQSVINMFGRHLYAGLVDGRAWGVSIRPGNHEGLISIEVFERVQRKLKGGVYAPARKDIVEDFPLRGAVSCCECSTPLTAGWSKGKYKKYPYYFCRSKGCARYGKTIPRKKIEGDFAELLSAIQPARGLVQIAAAMFKDYWNTRTERALEVGAALKRELVETEKKIEQLVEAVVEATNPRVIAAYEQRIEKLERQKLVLAEKEDQSDIQTGSFEKLFELSIRFLASPCKIWDSGSFQLQRLVLKLVFSEHLAYCRETGFRTPKTTLPFSMLGSFCVQEKEMVPPEWIEHSTSPLPRVRSTTELRRQCRLAL